MTEDEGPRWRPMWVTYDYSGTFIGRAGLLDAYIEVTRLGHDYQTNTLHVVGPDRIKIYEKSQHNFDVFNIIDGNIVSDENTTTDLHIGLEDMCQLYALVERQGLLTLAEEESENVDG